MRLSENAIENIEIEIEMKQLLLEHFKLEFDKESYLEEIWSWAPWIKTMGDCRRYHAHIMFRMLQKEILQNKKWEFAHDVIYGYLQEIFENEYPEIDQKTGRIVYKNDEGKTELESFKEFNYNDPKSKEEKAEVDIFLNSIQNHAL